MAAATPPMGNQVRVIQARGARLGKLPVMETFGPVVQGEGILTGVRTHFIRLGYCDYRCTWCDTKFAVEPKQVLAGATWMTPEEIVDQVEALSLSKWVTISGGNPAIHDLTKLIEGLHTHHYWVAIETQGSLCPSWVEDCDLVTISPKPPSSGMKTDWAKLGSIVSRTMGYNCLKVVVFDEEDFQYALQVRQAFSDPPFWVQVGTDIENPDNTHLIAKLTWLTERTLQEPRMVDAHVGLQLHTLMFGQQRGK